MSTDVLSPDDIELFIVLFHTRGIKHNGPPRIISNTEAGLREPMVLARTPDTGYSILEESIRAALREAPEIPPDARACRF